MRFTDQANFASSVAGPVTIRHACSADHAALERLAALDSQTMPGGPLLIAEIDGEPWAAVQIAGTGVIADPFRLTGGLVELLRERARQLVRAAPPRRRARSRNVPERTLRDGLASS